MPRRFTGNVPPMLIFGTIAAAGIAVATCSREDEPKELAFSSPQQCMDAGIDQQICQAEYQQALQKHIADAPHYADLKACEAAVGEGKCFQATPPGQGDSGQTTSGSGSGFFVPFMTGYLVSSALSHLSNYGAYRDWRYSSRGYSPTPIYRDRSGRSVTSTITGGQRTTRPANVNTRTVSRYGFGGRSSSRGFFGG
ncbi:DUF1190 domain-containing protein [Jiella sp. M17.18]|uniref:DUF1190 domain-containing protein n=1 Tax=Jiella sp. M17.18 TaxID=3234247 RepID=UPI0034DF6F28